jgi:hypothetical protein
VVPVAFTDFGTDQVVGLFLSFAAGLLIGVVGPTWHTVWHLRRPLRDLGIGVDRIGQTLALGLVLAAVQFAITLWGYDLPEPVDWVPLLVTSLVRLPTWVGAAGKRRRRGRLPGTTSAQRSSPAPAPAGLAASAVVSLAVADVLCGLWRLNQVSAPTTPSTTNPNALWKAQTLACVLSPNSPSTGPGSCPALASTCCRWLTHSPQSPRRRIGSSVTSPPPSWVVPPFRANASATWDPGPASLAHVYAIHVW